MARTSYSSATTGFGNHVNELVQLLRKSRMPSSDGIDWTIRLFEDTKQRVFEATGVRIENMKTLDIGPGQQLGCMRCFATQNDVVAIDTDVIAQNLDPRELLRMFRHNAALRTAKTVIRKALGVDSAFAKGLAERLGVPDFPKLPVLTMSATDMKFPDGNFDFVYSHSCFEHIDDPAAALAEVRRVLKPSGVAYVSVHLYTSHSGCHDPKIFADGKPLDPLWPHLRPQLAHTVHPNTYLNRLRLAEWRSLFTETMPGCTFYHQRQDDEIGDRLQKLREAGELVGYTDEELMTVNLVAIWRAPATKARVVAA